MRALDVSAEGLVALHAGDFARLAGLGSLDLSLNRIASLPEGVFAGLGRLTSLHLDGNALATLPAGVSVAGTATFAFTPEDDHFEEGDETVRVWSVRDAGALARGGGFEPGQRLDAEVGYGLRGPLRAGVMTPFAGVSLSDGGRRSWRLGSRWRPLPAVRLGVEATRTETPSAATPEQALVLRLELSF